MANVDYATGCTDTVVTLTNANQQYALPLGDGVKAIEIYCAEAFDVFVSFQPGKVAGADGLSSPLLPYQTVKSGATYAKDRLYLGATSLYLACATAGKHVVVRVWS